MWQDIPPKATFPPLRLSKIYYSITSTSCLIDVQLLSVNILKRRVTNIHPLLQYANEILEVELKYLFLSLCISLFPFFGQRIRMGRCPIEHRGECPSVRPNKQTSEQTSDCPSCSPQDSRTPVPPPGPQPPRVSEPRPYGLSLPRTDGNSPVFCRTSSPALV